MKIPQSSYLLFFFIIPICCINEYQEIYMKLTDYQSRCDSQFVKNTVVGDLPSRMDECSKSQCNFLIFNNTNCVICNGNFYHYIGAVSASEIRYIKVQNKFDECPTMQNQIDAIGKYLYNKTLSCDGSGYVYYKSYLFSDFNINDINQPVNFSYSF